jgi:unsaturated rhamnogalacturonyl hydrolase
LSYELVEKLKQQYKNGEGKWFLHRWHYIESCILKSYLDSYHQTQNKEDYEFVKDFIDRLFNAEGIISEIDVKYCSIDQIRMASILLTLYKTEADPKYKRVADVIYEQLKTYPRTASGNFWHKENYPNQVWLDGLYMGQPFYVEYIKEFVASKDYSDTLRQFASVHKNLWVEEKHLYPHAFDESKEIFWSNKENGHSPNVWCRAVGWLVMALVDVMELLEGENVDTSPLKSMLKETVDGMLPYQHSSGMWYQVVDRGDNPKNYLESSGTLMLSYAMLKGVRLGYLSSEYAKYGKSAFEGTITRYVYETDGEVKLGGICKSAGLGIHPDTGAVRDGSFEYYIHGESIVENNGHGVAPLFMAFNEIKLAK